MSNLNDERSVIAGKLQAAGLTVSIDPRAAVPVVLIASPSVIETEGIGGWVVEYPIQILGTPPGNSEALAWMLDALEKVLTVFFGPAVPRQIEHAGAEVPAYVVTITRSVNNPTC